MAAERHSLDPDNPRRDMRTEEGPHPAPQPRRSFIPPAYLYPEDGGYVVLTDMVGVDPASVHVVLADHRLVISGRVDESRFDGPDAPSRERTVERYAEAVKVPDGVDEEHIEVTLNNGVVRVFMPALDDVGLN